MIHSLYDHNVLLYHGSCDQCMVSKLWAETQETPQCIASVHTKCHASEETVLFAVLQAHMWTMHQELLGEAVTLREISCFFSTSLLSAACKLFWQCWMRSAAAWASMRALNACASSRSASAFLCRCSFTSLQQTSVQPQLYSTSSANIRCQVMQY